MVEQNEAIEFADLGDAKVETKQVHPIPPYYADSVFGFGARPNSIEDQEVSRWHRWLGIS